MTSQRAASARLLAATVGALLAGCSSDSTVVDATPVDLYGLWLNVDDQDGSERVWVFSERDDYFVAAAGRGDISSICVAGEVVQVSAFEVAEGHVVESVLDDRDGGNVGARFGTEIIALSGDTLVMESRSHPSGRRTWTRIRRYEPRAASGWTLAFAPTEAGSPFPTGATSIAFDADDDWHVVASGQRIGSIPGGGTGGIVARGFYGSRKNTCATRGSLLSAFNGGSLVVDGDQLVLPMNRVADDLIAVATRPVGDNLTAFAPWQESLLDGIAGIVTDSFARAPDGTLRLVRRDVNGVTSLWRRPPGGVWASTPLDLAPATRVVYDTAGRAAFITFRTWSEDLLLWREQPDGTFVSEPVTGSGSASGWNGPADLAAAPDGTIRVISGHRGVEIFTRGAGGWTSALLTRTPTPVALAVGDDGVHHVWSTTEDRVTYLRWDGTTVTRELPALAGALDMSRDTPNVRLSADGQVALVMGGGQVAIRPADAADRRRTVTLTVTKDGEGDVAIEGHTGTCGSTCTFEIPAGTFVRFTATPGPGHVYAGIFDGTFARPAIEPEGTSGLFPIESVDTTMRVVFLRSNVARVVALRPAELRFTHVDALADGRAAVVVSATAAWELGGVPIPAGPSIGLLDDAGAWLWARALPSGLIVSSVRLMPGGGVALLGTFGGTIDLGTGAITQTSNLGLDAVIVRFANNGATVFATHVPTWSGARALTTLGANTLVAAVYPYTTVDIDGHTLAAGLDHLLALDATGHVTHARAITGRPAALAASGTMIAAIGADFEATTVGQTATIAAFDATLTPLWTRGDGTLALTRVAFDAAGRVHVYGPSRGGDYGGGDLPDPTGPGQPHGSVHAVFTPTGAFVSARGIAIDYAPVGLSADGDDLVFVMGLGRPVLARIGANTTADRFVNLAASQPAVPSGQTASVGGAWLGNRFRLFANQSGFENWTIEAGTRNGGVIVDGVY